MESAEVVSFDQFFQKVKFFHKNVPTFDRHLLNRHAREVYKAYLKMKPSSPEEIHRSIEATKTVMTRYSIRCVELGIQLGRQQY